MGQIDSLPPGADAKLVANAKGKDRFLSTLSYWTLARVHPNSSKLQTVAIERIAERLTDDEPFIRAAAAKALASLPPQPEITLPILEKILRDADEETISHVLGALATIGKPAVPQLIKALRHEKLRVPVISVLGMIGPDAADATEPLSQLLEDEDANVAIEAALTLAKIGPPAASAVPALSSALKRKDCCNAHAIVIALAKIGPPAAETSPQLEKLMQSDDPSLAALAAWTTTQVYPGSAEVAAKAIPVMEKGLAEPLPEARRAAAEALGTLGSLAKPAIPALQAAAKDADPSVQTAANQAIKQIQAGGQK
jgi:HEAT repeat protein